MVNVKLSRPQQWGLACQSAARALEELINLQEEYETWLRYQPGNLEGSPTTDRLVDVTQLPLNKALDIVLNAQSIELPKGFGRD
jgi:hypothetical protein